MWKINIEIFLPTEPIYDYRLKLTATSVEFPTGTGISFSRYIDDQDPDTFIEPYTQVTSAAHGLSTGDRVIISNTDNQEDLPDGTYTVTVIDENIFWVKAPRVYPYTPRTPEEEGGVAGDWVKVGFDPPTEYDTAKIFLWQKDDTHPKSAPVDVEYFTNVCSVADLTLRPEDTGAAPEDTLYRKDYLDMVFRSESLMMEALEMLKLDMAGLRDAIVDVVTVKEDPDYDTGV